MIPIFKAIWTQENRYSDDLLAQLNEEDSPVRDSPRRWLAWTPIFLALFALLGLLGWGMVHQQAGASNVGTNDSPMAVVVLKRPAVDFSGPLYESFQGKNEFRLSDYRGQVVVNFWAS